MFLNTHTAPLGGEYPPFPKDAMGFVRPSASVNTVQVAAKSTGLELPSHVKPARV